MLKTIKSIFDYLLHNERDKTYTRVLRAHLKYPFASLYELQHGVNSAASVKYRIRHPPDDTYQPDYVDEMTGEFERQPELSVHCFRDHLVGQKYSYKGINLYFVEYDEMAFFESVRNHFKRMFSDYFGGMDYKRNDISTCSADDIHSHSGDVYEHDFIFDIGDIKSAKLQYWGYWHNRNWEELKLFDGFDVGRLEKLLP